MNRVTAALVGALTLTAVVVASGPADARPAEQSRALSAPQSATQAPAVCSQHNAVPFVPKRVRFGAAGSSHVLAMPRQHGVPGTPPLTDQGKHQTGWDRPGVRPGAAMGHVLMNAHAWPDGTALGNALVSHLRVGDRIKVYGRGQRVQCYRVVRLVIKVPSHRLTTLYYGYPDSAPRLAIVTCAGVRRGPGDWAKRAVWLAEPVA